MISPVGHLPETEKQTTKSHLKIVPINDITIWLSSPHTNVQYGVECHTLLLIVTSGRFLKSLQVIDGLILPSPTFEFAQIPEGNYSSW